MITNSELSFFLNQLVIANLGRYLPHAGRAALSRRATRSDVTLFISATIEGVVETWQRLSMQFYKLTYIFRSPCFL